jgi:uncharacterized membrane protein
MRQTFLVSFLALSLVGAVLVAAGVVTNSPAAYAWISAGVALLVGGVQGALLADVAISAAAIAQGQSAEYAEQKRRHEEWRAWTNRDLDIGTQGTNTVKRTPDPAFDDAVDELLRPAPRKRA